MTIGNKIKDYRLKKTLTQEQLAKLLNVSRSTVSSWEVERNYPDLQTLISISDLFGISLDNLLREDGDMVKDVSKKMKWNKFYKLILTFIVVFAVGYLGYSEKLRLDVRRYQSNLEYYGWSNSLSSKDSTIYTLHEDGELNKIINYSVTIDWVSSLERPLNKKRLAVVAKFHQHDFSIEVLDKSTIIVTLPLPHGAGLFYSVTIDEKLNVIAKKNQPNKNVDLEYTERYIKANKDNIQKLIEGGLEKRAEIIKKRH